MRFVPRSDAVPSGFEDRARAEYDKVVAHRGDPSKTKSFKFAVYKTDSIKRLLEDMFAGKCAYCETFYAATQPMDVEHYRPKGAVAEDADHDGYWWLAMKWDNLLPSCIDCNRKRKQVLVEPQFDGDHLAGLKNAALQGAGKKDSFPVADPAGRAAVPIAQAQDLLAAISSPHLAQEKPLLLNPCDDQPDLHLVHHFTDPAEDANNPAPVSFLLAAKLADGTADDFRDANGLSRKGKASIQIYGLNRLSLVQARTELLRRLEFLKSVIIRLHSLADEIDEMDATGGLADQVSAMFQKSATTMRSLADQITGEINQMSRDQAPYASMVKAWRAQFLAELQA